MGVSCAGPIVSPIDVKAATDNRDSLAKTIYSRLFDWLVVKINSAIGQVGALHPGVQTLTRPPGSRSCTTDISLAWLNACAVVGPSNIC